MFNMNFPSMGLMWFHLLTLSSAHFSLYTPIAIGANISGGPMEGTGPCGSFEITNRDTVTDWPVAGYPVYLVTTHPVVVFEFRAALVNDTTTWVNLIPPITQDGVGFFCEPAMPGFALWSGLPVVLQVAQYAPDGINYQCAAINFVPGGPAPIGTCMNSSLASAAPAISFTSIPPYGSVITPTATALVTNSAKGSNATITSSTPTATTSKASSGAVARFEGQEYPAVWMLLTMLLGLGAWLL